MGKATSTTVGVLVGGAIGAISALLLAPKRGEEMRSDVKGWARETEHKAAAKIRETGSKAAGGIRQVPHLVSEKAPQMASKVRGMFSRQSEQAAETVEAGSQMAAGRMEEAAERMPE